MSRGPAGGLLVRRAPLGAGLLATSLRKGVARPARTCMNVTRLGYGSSSCSANQRSRRRVRAPSHIVPTVPAPGAPLEARDEPIGQPFSHWLQPLRQTAGRDLYIGVDGPDLLDRCRKPHRRWRVGSSHGHFGRTRGRISDSGCHHCPSVNRLLHDTGPDTRGPARFLADGDVEFWLPAGAIAGASIGAVVGIAAVFVFWWTDDEDAVLPDQHRPGDIHQGERAQGTGDADTA